MALLNEMLRVARTLAPVAGAVPTQPPPALLKAHWLGARAYALQGKHTLASKEHEPTNTMGALRSQENPAA